MSAAEFSRPVRLDTLGEAPRAIRIAAEETERAALARRFGLVSIERLEADAELRRVGEAVIAIGRLDARAMQSCVATGESVEAEVAEPFALRFEPDHPARGSEEVELGAEDLDVLPIAGGAIDLGEAVAQEFALALDPFPRAPDAARHLREAGVLSEEEAADRQREGGPFAVLKGLLGKS